MKQHDFKNVAQVIAEIKDPWARNQAVNRACFRLGQNYSHFNANFFRHWVWMFEEGNHRDEKKENNCFNDGKRSQ